MIESFTVATANTQMGRAIRESGGLKPLAGVDALLLQEVKMERDELAEKLSSDIGMTLGHYDKEYALAIAIDPRHSLKHQYEETLQPRGRAGRLIQSAEGLMDTTSFRLRARGLLAVTLETTSSNRATVAAVHPTVQPKLLSRNKQVRAIPSAVSGIDTPLVVAGDMNHWPGPHKVDRQMYEDSGLTPVEIKGSTFDFNQTRYAWLGRILLSTQLDAMLYRGQGLEPIATELVDIPSDHRAVITTFELGQ